MPDLVSILIPCFNAERWVGEAIESSLAQTWHEKEVIVVDDGSTDASLEVIKRFGTRIQWETGNHRGGNVTRNRLLELASGKWLQYLDADDYLSREKITRQMEFVLLRPEYDVIFGPVTIQHQLDAGAYSELLEIPEPRDPWVLLARWYLPQTGAALWLKQAIAEVGGWKADQPCCQEHELYLRLLMSGKRFGYCAEGGAVYRHWGEHTLCNANKPLVHRQRLAIEQIAEQFLRQEDCLTPERLWAINQARFEVARIAWLYDRAFARDIIKTISLSQPKFIPSGNAAPRHYQMIFRLFGFERTEKIAAYKRRLY